VKFSSDMMSYIMLRGRLYNIIVLNVHAPTHDKIYDIAQNKNCGARETAVAR
jgi:hypothetical protein